ncbi:hypothetical protein [Lysobacter sp. F60174L2]|uniref:hypothetical protein n=1 Tax=Lysobacter sp. F60174L2 TaxID=3459295 RepID=UPI00403E050F
MPWLLFLLAVVALVIALTTTSVALLSVCLVGALVLTLMGVMQLLARRIDRRSGGDGPMLDPLELQQLRAQAEARRAAASQAGSEPG